MINGIVVQNNPLKYIDPEGLVARKAYNWADDVNLGTRALGGLQAAGGIAEAGVGIAGGALTSWTGVGAVLGGAAAYHGTDQAIAGFRTAITGEHTRTVTSQAIGLIPGVSENTADTVDSLLSIPLTIGASAFYKAPQQLSKATQAASKSTIIKANKIAGDLGEDAVRARLLNSKNVDLVGEQIRINTPGVGSHRITDFLVRGKNSGKLRNIEVKTGYATRDATQLAKDNLIADPLSPTTFFGKNANNAGFSNGTPTGPIRTFEVNASNLRK